MLLLPAQIFISRMPLAGNGSRGNVQNVDGELQETLQLGQITTIFFVFQILLCSFFLSWQENLLWWFTSCWISLLIVINAQSHQMKAHHKETIRVIAANITILPSNVNVSVDLCQISKPSMWGTTQSSINQFSPKQLWTWMIINYFWLKIPILCFN